MRLSVAICTRNRAGLLAQTLESLVAVRVPDGLEWELVVVDNGSTDGTPDVLRRFSAGLPLRALNEPTAGKSRALNRATAALTGEHVVWTDDDVLLDPSWLEAYAAGIRQYPDAVLFGGPVKPWFEAPPPQWVTDNWARLAVAYAAFDLGPEPSALEANHVPHGANVAVRVAEQRRYLYDVRLGPGVSRGLRGEEITVFRAMLEAGLPGRWLPAAGLRHFVPKERVRFRYLFDYYYGQGTFDGLTNPEARRPRVQLWAMREFFTASLGFAAMRTTGSSRWVRYLDRAASALGMLAGVRQRARDTTPGVGSREARSTNA